MAKKTIAGTGTMTDLVSDVNDNFTELYAPSRGNMYNTVSIVADLVTAWQWYSLEDTNLNSANLKDFTFSNWVFTFTGEDWTKFLFNWAANIKTDKACELTFWLFVNTGLVSWGTTPIDLTAQNKKSNMAIATIITLNNWDEVKIKAKSDTANTELTLLWINTVLWGH